MSPYPFSINKSINKDAYDTEKELDGMKDKIKNINSVALEQIKNVFLEFKQGK